MFGALCWFLVSVVMAGVWFGDPCWSAALCCVCECVNPLLYEAHGGSMGSVSCDSVHSNQWRQSHCAHASLAQGILGDVVNVVLSQISHIWWCCRLLLISLFTLLLLLLYHLSNIFTWYIWIIYCHYLFVVFQVYDLGSFNVKINRQTRVMTWCASW